MEPIFVSTIWILSFISLFLSIFWIFVLYFDNSDIAKIRKITKYPMISLIIPVKDGADVLANTIKSVLKLDYPKDKLEIIVSENNSTDNSVSIAKKFEKFGVKVLSRNIPGKGAAINFARKFAKGEILGIIDDDVRVSKNALKLMVPYFEEKGVGAVVSAIKVRKPKNFLQKLQWFEYLFVSLCRRLLASLDALYVTPGALSLYRADAIEKIGGFDEHSITEDLEIAMRLQYNHYKIKSELGAISETHVPLGVSALHNQRVRWYRGWLVTAYKYRDMLFNKKYGFLGSFQMPISVISPILLMILTISLGFQVFKSSRLYLGILSTFNWNLFGYLSSIDVKSYFLSFDAIIFPTIFVAILGFYLMKKAMTHLNEVWKYPIATLCYFTVYQTFLSSYWFIAATHEAVKSKRKW